ncbi:hypothetical protein H0H81_002057, partial [Sphagnurus paluster]
PSPASDSSYKQITEAKWDIANIFLVACFLTLSLLLSECKVAQIKSSPPIRVTVRVNLQSMYADIGRELKVLGLQPPQRDMKKCDGKVKMNTQCDAMQGYVSVVTTD